MTRRASVESRRLPCQARSRETIDAIVSGASLVVAAEGFHAATTSRIAARAGVSVGSLYQYFPNREALLAAIVRHRLAAFESTLRATFASTAGRHPARRIRAMLEALVAAKRSDLEVSAALAHRLDEIGSGIPEEANRVKAVAVELVHAVLRDAADTAALADPGMAAFVVVHAIDGALLAAMREGGARLADPAFVDDLARLALAYLRLSDDEPATDRR